MHIVSADQHGEFNDLLIVVMRLQTREHGVGDFDIHRHGAGIGEQRAVRGLEQTGVFTTVEGGDLLRRDAARGRVFRGVDLKLIVRTVQLRYEQDGQFARLIVKRCVKADGVVEGLPRFGDRRAVQQQAVEVDQLAAARTFEFANQRGEGAVIFGD